MKRHGFKKTDRGFTLIEVVVALAIVAVGIAAVSELAVHTTSTTVKIRARVYANWAAANHMAELRLNSKVTLPAEGSSSKNIELGGKSWVVVQEVTSTTVEGAVRVEVNVFEAENQEQATTSLASYFVKAI